jgi:hypothetical protein
LAVLLIGYGLTLACDEFAIIAEHGFQIIFEARVFETRPQRYKLLIAHVLQDGIQHIAFTLFFILPLFVA